MPDGCPLPDGCAAPAVWETKRKQAQKKPPIIFIIRIFFIESFQLLMGFTIIYEAVFLIYADTGNRYSCPGSSSHTSS